MKGVEWAAFRGEEQAEAGFEGGSHGIEAVLTPRELERVIAGDAVSSITGLPRMLWSALAKPPGVMSLEAHVVVAEPGVGFAAAAYPLRLGALARSQHQDIEVGMAGITVVVFWWLIFSKGWSPEERKRSAALLVLFIASALFWASFEQAGSTLNFFADRNTDRAIMGFIVPAPWFQSVQPVFVVSLAPVFAWLWLWLNRRKLEPSSPGKFTLGLVFGGSAFAILIPAAIMAADGIKVGM